MTDLTKHTIKNADPNQFPPMEVTGVVQDAEDIETFKAPTGFLLDTYVQEKYPDANLTKTSIMNDGIKSHQHLDTQSLWHKRPTGLKVIASLKDGQTIIYTGKYDYSSTLPKAVRIPMPKTHETK